MTQCFAYTIKDNGIFSFLSSLLKLLWWQLCLSLLTLGSEVRLGVLVSVKALSPHVCWHASLNKFPHHPSRNASLYRIRLWQTSLYSVAEAPPPPPLPPAFCTVWRGEVRGFVCHRSDDQFLHSQLWPWRPYPMAAGSDATVHPMSQPPHLKLCIRGSAPPLHRITSWRTVSQAVGQNNIEK